MNDRTFFQIARYLGDHFRCRGFSALSSLGTDDLLLMVGMSISLTTSDMYKREKRGTRQEGI
jgi:hypothetical protein